MSAKCQKRAFRHSFDRRRYLTNSAVLIWHPVTLNGDMMPELHLGYTWPSFLFSA